MESLGETLDDELTAAATQHFEEQDEKREQRENLLKNLDPKYRIGGSAEEWEKELKDKKAPKSISVRSNGSSKSPALPSSTVDDVDSSGKKRKKNGSDTPKTSFKTPKRYKRKKTM